MTATRIIYAAAGAPERDDLVIAEGQCWLCGESLSGQGVPYRLFVKDTFTDHDKAKCPESQYVCPACAFCADDRNATLTARLGRDKLQRMRNYSHFVVNGEWLPLSKAEKTRMYELLPRADLAIIADSGQKHIIFRARPGCWQFEEQSIWPDWPLLESMSAAINELYSVFNKTEIATADYGAQRIRQFGLTRWAALEYQIKSHRGSAIFKLAVYLAQKGEEDGTTGEPRGKGSADCDGRASIDGLAGVGQQAAEVLADSDRSGEKCGLYEQPGEVHQYTLFQDGASSLGEK